MSTLIAVPGKEPWRRRLTLPSYHVKDAARYANITSKTILNWQRQAANAGAALSSRDKGVALSYLQLVEVAFVAVLRDLGVKLVDIRNARDYMAQKFNAEYPFAQKRFKSDGQDILMELPEFAKDASKNNLVKVNKGGQIAWGEIIECKFEEFDYAKDLAVCWRVGGKGSLIQIDPRISFGAPAIKGVPTWVVKGRWEVGESIEDIAEDFNLKEDFVFEALRFEGITNIH